MAAFPIVTCVFAVGFGLATIEEQYLPALAILGGYWIVLAIKNPTFAVYSCFVGLLMDSLGRTGLSFAGLPVTLSKISVVATLLAWVAHVTVTQKRFVEITPITFPLMLVVASMITSLMASVNPMAGFDKLAGVGMLIVMLHLVTVTLPRSLEGIRSITRRMAYLFVIVTVVNVWQGRAVTGEDFMFHGWGGRSSGTFEDPNEWCTTVLMISPLLMGALLEDKHWTARPVLAAVTVLLPLTIFQSLSRSGLVAFVVVAPGVVYLLRRYRMTLFTGGLAVAVILPFVVNIDTWIFRYETLVNPTIESDLGLRSINEREALFWTGIRIFQDHPILGVGHGMFRFHASDATSGGVWKVAHNSYLTVAAEQGLVGVVTHLVFVVATARMAWSAFVLARSQEVKNMAIGTGVGLAGFALMAFTLNLATHAIAYYAFGYLVVVYRLAQREADQAIRNAVATKPEPISRRRVVEPLPADAR